MQQLKILVPESSTHFQKLTKTNRKLQRYAKIYCWGCKEIQGCTGNFINMEGGLYVDRNFKQHLGIKRFEL